MRQKSVDFKATISDFEFEVTEKNKKEFKEKPHEFVKKHLESQGHKVNAVAIAKGFGGEINRNFPLAKPIMMHIDSPPEYKSMYIIFMPPKFV